MVLVVDAEIRTGRVAQGGAGALFGVAVALVVVGVRPGLLRAHAVPVPALHRAAAAGARIAFALPLVVAARHVVEHARTHAGGVGAGAARAQQGVGDRRRVVSGKGGSGLVVLGGRR